MEEKKIEEITSIYAIALKMLWQRNKNDDTPEIPITRTIAKVIQKQQEYNRIGGQINGKTCFATIMV